MINGKNSSNHRSNECALTSVSAQAVIDVAVAVLYRQQDDNKEYLVARRALNVDQGGKLEFVGGKVEQGERTSLALARELAEELGIYVSTDEFRRMGRIDHRYADRCVRLWVFTLALVGDEFGDSMDGVCLQAGKLGQALYWLTGKEIEAKMHEFPAANRLIIQWLSLPDVLRVSAKVCTYCQSNLCSTYAQMDAQSWLDCYAVLGDTKNSWLSVRTKLGADETCSLLQKLIKRQTNPCKLIVPLSVYLSLATEKRCGELYQAIKAVRLTHHELMADDTPWHRLQAVPIFASCHDAKSITRVNERLSAGFLMLAITLSPVQATQSHIDALPLGWSNFAQLANTCHVPVYALGGLGSGDLETAWRYGAYGVAGIRQMTI